jgi:HEAT repeats
MWRLNVKIIVGTMGVILLLTIPATALALAFETFGNAPVGKHPNWADGVVDVVNLKSRVYAHLADGQHTYFFGGGAPGVNEALRKYAAVRADSRQVILLPGSGKTQSFAGKPIPFDWHVQTPGGRAHPAGWKHAVMTVYINGTKPRPLEPKQVEKWLDDLNSEAFETRDKANRELQKLGNDGKPFLRAALKPAPTLEARRRIEALLQRLRELDVTDLEIPQGVTVISVNDLLAQGLKGLKDPDRNVRWFAIWDLSSLAPYSDRVVPALADLLKSDPDMNVRRVAADYLGKAGVQAKSAMAVLKKGQEDVDANVRTACQTALMQIDRAKVTPAQQEQRRRELAIAIEIDEFKSIGSSRDCLHAER